MIMWWNKVTTLRNYKQTLKCLSFSSKVSIFQFVILQYFHPPTTEKQIWRKDSITQKLWNYFCRIKLLVNIIQFSVMLVTVIIMILNRYICRLKIQKRWYLFLSQTMCFLNFFLSAWLVRSNEFQSSYLSFSQYNYFPAPKTW